MNNTWDLVQIINRGKLIIHDHPVSTQVSGHIRTLAINKDNLYISGITSI